VGRRWKNSHLVGNHLTSKAYKMVFSILASEYMSRDVGDYAGVDKL
jgi:hypothetical protein